MKISKHNDCSRLVEMITVARENALRKVSEELIMSSTKSAGEREFYIKLCIQACYSKRELERQLQCAYFEQYMLSQQKIDPIALPQTIRNQFLDQYTLEFLELPETFFERDLQNVLPVI